MLQIERLDGFYGESQVLHQVSLRLEPGEVVALMGRNGSGRSSLARAVMGMLHCRGEICWKDRILGHLPTHEIARRGLGYVSESRDVFGGLTVAQNLLLGQKVASNQAACLKWSQRAAFDRFPELARRADTQAGVLSGGEQQLLSLCRCLMGHPECLVLDEPMEGLSPELAARVGTLLEECRDQGLAVLLIEQKLDISAVLAPRCYVLGRGAVVYDGPTHDALQESSPASAWLRV